MVQAQAGPRFFLQRRCCKTYFCCTSFLGVYYIGLALAVKVEMKSSGAIGVYYIGLALAVKVEMKSSGAIDVNNIGLALAVKVEMKSSGAMEIVAFSIAAPLFIYTLLQPQREKKSRKSDEKLFSNS